MRSVYLFMMISLDGYFEGVDHDISWHNVDEVEFNSFALKQIQASDVLLFGHRTYDLMAGYWPTAEVLEEDPIIARAMNDIDKIVFSTTLSKADWQNTRVESDAVATVRGLKSEPGRDIAIFGSNKLCVSLMTEGLVDEFRIMVNPVAIGDGRSLFTGLKKRVDLELVKSQAFTTGNVLLTYRRKSGRS